MMRILCVAGIMLAAPALAQDWSPINVGTTSDILNIGPAVGFSDLWLVGRNGLVAESDYIRTSWTIHNANTTADLYSVRRPTSTQIWVSGDQGAVRVKTNLTGFETRNVPNGQERFVMHSRASGVQNALGSAGALYNSQDLGAHWTTLNSGVQISLNHGAGYTGATNWMVGDGGLILKSTDGSVTWTPKPSGTGNDLNYMVEAVGYLVVVGDNGTILRSNDGGESWTQSFSGTSEDLHSMSTSGASGFHLLAVGDNGTVLYSSDTGATWCSLDPGTTADLYGVSMVNNSEYIVAGQGGVMMRTTNGGGDCMEVSGVEDSSAPVPVFALHGPRPNPFASRGTVILEVTDDQHVSAGLYDLAGRRVAAVFDGTVLADRSQHWTLDAGRLPAGAYFLRIQGETFETSRKIVTLR